VPHHDVKHDEQCGDDPGSPRDATQNSLTPLVEQNLARDADVVVERNQAKNPAREQSSAAVRSEISKRMRADHQAESGKNSGGDHAAVDANAKRPADRVSLMSRRRSGAKVMGNT
jgi:hypothetical protein